MIQLHFWYYVALPVSLLVTTVWTTVCNWLISIVNCLNIQTNAAKFDNTRLQFNDFKFWSIRRHFQILTWSRYGRIWVYSFTGLDCWIGTLLDWHILGFYTCCGWVNWPSITKGPQGICSPLIDNRKLTSKYFATCPIALLNLNAARNTTIGIEYRPARHILGCSYGIKVSFTVFTISQVALNIIIYQ